MFKRLRELSAKLHEQSARHWTARCLTCGARFPYPGVRVGAAGKPSKLLRCPRCGRWRCCRIEPVREG